MDGRVRVLGSPLGVISQAPHLREKNTVRPAHIGAGQLWWYTHLGLRRARGTLAGAVKAGHMFTWLTSATAGQNIARTTSPLEGGINAGLKDLLRTHHGLTPDHAARAVD